MMKRSLLAGPPWRPAWALAGDADTRPRVYAGGDWNFDRLGADRDPAAAAARGRGDGGEPVPLRSAQS
jgi:hypothetical protein